MKYFITCMALSFTITALTFAQPLVLTFSDFNVESMDPQHKYIGKGLSRLVAGELNRSGTVTILEREAIERVLEEQELSLSDIADPARRAQIGKLLSAEYIVLGEIIDMGRVLMLSLRMVNAGTGEVEWQEEMAEELESYDYIAAYFARSILGYLGLKANPETARKIEEREKKNRAAIVRLSEGLDAYDRGEKEKARKVLSEARRLDPHNQVARDYLSKLITNTTKFQVLTEPYYTYQNPAYLGVMEADRLHFNYSQSALDQSFAVDGLREMDWRLLLGYYAPVGQRVGLGLDTFLSMIRNDLEGATDDIYTSRFWLGAVASGGIRLGERFAVGLGLSLFRETNYMAPMDPLKDRDYVINRPAWAVNLGTLYRTPSEDLVLDARIGYTSATIDIIDPDAVVVEGTSRMPLYTEGTLTLAFPGRRMFLITKQINEISLDRSLVFCRILPAVEYYPSSWVSLRLGLEGSFIRMNNTSMPGYGVLTGITLRRVARNFDMDINLTWRQRPSRTVEEYLIDDILLLVNLSRSRLSTPNRNVP